jgi:hypothetical protein
MSSSSKSNAVVDWCTHRIDYMENHAPNGISARKYLDNQNLNVNSGRRQFAAMAKLEEDGLSYDEIRKQLFSKASGGAKSGSDSGVKSGSSGSKSGSQTSGSPKKSDPKEKKPASKRSTSSNGKPSKIKDLASDANQVNGSRLSPAANNRSKKGIRLTTPLQQEFIDKSSDSQIGNGGRFGVGNSAAVTTGAYVNLVHAHSDIIDAVLNCRMGDVSGLVKLSEIRYIQMERLLKDRVDSIAELARKGVLPKGHDGEVRTKEDLEREALWSSSGAMTGLLGTLSMAHTQASKAMVDNQIKLDRHYRDTDDRTYMIEVAERRANEEITSLEAARLLEARGIAPSPIVTAEALKEIEMMKPKIDTTGISDEELDAVVDEYLEETKAIVEGMPERRARLEELMLQSKAELEGTGLSESDFADKAYTGLEDVEFSGIDSDGIEDVGDGDFEWGDD